MPNSDKMTIKRNIKMKRLVISGIALTKVTTILYMPFQDLMRRKTRRTRSMRRIRRKESLTPPPAKTADRTISIIDKLTIVPSSWFQPSDQYPAQPKPSSLRPISAMKIQVSTRDACSILSAYESDIPSNGSVITAILNSTKHSDPVLNKLDVTTPASQCLTPPATGVQSQHPFSTSALRSASDATCSAPKRATSAPSAVPPLAAFSSSTKAASSASCSFLIISSTKCAARVSSKMTARKRLTTKKPPKITIRMK
mmetsp:Transcript_9396/g.19229  ORF Transcript_9396/g.19229 Transcript_9396/m.19229 type:complete len:255 (+) Transcript_9396:1793-2557(+)